MRQPDRFVLAPGLVYRSAKCGDLLPMKSLISILAGILSAVLLFTLGRTSCLSRTISDDGQQPVDIVNRTGYPSQTLEPPGFPARFIVTALAIWTFLKGTHAGHRLGRNRQMEESPQGIREREAV